MLVAGVLWRRRAWLFGSPAGRRAVAVAVVLASVHVSGAGLYRFGNRTTGPSASALLLIAGLVVGAVALGVAIGPARRRRAS